MRWLIYFAPRLIYRRDPCFPLHRKKSSSSSSINWGDYVRFKDGQDKPPKFNLIKAATEKELNKEFFYGIEVMPMPFATPLDYNAFGCPPPLFTAITMPCNPILCELHMGNSPTVQLSQFLQQRVPIVPSLTCYSLCPKLLREFLELPYENILVCFGYLADDEQYYPQTANLIEAIREIRKDDLTIAVAGYPEGHIESTTLEDDLMKLSMKIQNGGDLIVTQVCFNACKFVEFVRNCWAAHLNVPIMMGLHIPDSMKMLRFVLQLTRLEMPADQLAEYEKRQDCPEEFRAYAVEQAWQMTKDVTKACTEVYGIYFYTKNSLRTTHMFLAKMEKENLFDRCHN